ncbi:hypothetical protein CGRA01v4_14140 [Colletotrichum graminicola]|nr:hypothetical protein CGRA01v4_14140 [Colletotrichum graminicola]
MASSPTSASPAALPPPPPPAPEQDQQHQQHQGGLSVRPERRTQVRELLADLDRALNHLAEGPGAQIADLFPRLRAEFWKAACEIAVSGIHSGQPHDIRDWPLWLRARIPEPRLFSTLHPVFHPVVDEIRASPRRGQRFTRAAMVLGLRDYHMLLDFGTTICSSETALQNLAAFRYLQPAIPTDAIVRQVQAQMLLRPSLSPQEPPDPTVAECTAALNRKLPLCNPRR